MDLTDYFLLPAREARESIFAKSLIYICRHDDDGAFGLIVNKPTSTPVNDLLGTHNISAKLKASAKVMRGGPVRPEQIFILHTPKRKSYEVTVKVSKKVHLTMSRDILKAIDEGKAPSKMLFTFGHARWMPGQLEDELMQNVWITIPAESAIIFDVPPAQRSSAAAESLGFDISNFVTGQSGSA